jgi:hypothetical protein
VVRDGIRPADGAEVDGIEALPARASRPASSCRDGHNIRSLPTPSARSSMTDPNCCAGLQHANPFRQNFFANSVTRDGGNTIGFFIPVLTF